MAESRLQRWSRRKLEAGKESEPTPPAAEESAPSPEEQELAINEALPEDAVLEKYDLPDPNAIELGTDVTGFMRKEIPEFLRRKALRALWKSNPVLAVLDGLNDYDEDFSDAATAVEGVQTLYKVGQGLFDKTARVDKQVGEHVEDSIQKQTEVTETVALDKVAERSEPEIDIGESDTARHVEAEAEPAPRYRPRMRFDH